MYLVLHTGMYSTFFNILIFIQTYQMKSNNWSILHSNPYCIAIHIANDNCNKLFHQSNIRNFLLHNNVKDYKITNTINTNYYEGYIWNNYKLIV